MTRVVVAMSGGVDSSVAAWLLAEQGYEVVGLFMRHAVPEAAEPSLPAGNTDSATCPGSGQQPPTGKPRCCSAADAADARRVADRLGIAFYVLNFQEQFERIVDYFVAEYSAGRTPNPCIVCNSWLKFGKLVEYANSIGAELVATGHYARIQSCGPGNLPAVYCAADRQKDQTYVLFGIEREVLPRAMFPLGTLHKHQVRQIAGDLGLRVARKPDSQEICFVPDDDHAGLVRRRRGEGDTSGQIVTVDGRVVGRHDGLERFTVGQRKGLGVALGRRQFVVRLEPRTRRVVIGPREALACSELTATGANWLVDSPAEPFRCQVKIRYRSPAVPATVEPLDETRFRVRFAEPCYAVAAGQAAVCYDQDRLLGGGWIQ